MLAFPCNQFGRQAGGTDAEISGFACDKFKLPDDFRLMSTIKCKGKDASTVYKFLTAAWAGVGVARRPSMSERVGSFVLGSSVKWNFTKFLCGANGIPVKRYGPLTSPYKIRADAEKLIKAAPSLGADAMRPAAGSPDAVVTPTALAAPSEGVIGGVECG